MVQFGRQGISNPFLVLSNNRYGSKHVRIFNFFDGLNDREKSTMVQLLPFQVTILAKGSNIWDSL